MKTQKRKCYISGKITGLPIDEAIKNFNKASLHAMFLGYDVINPLHIEPDGEEPKTENEKWNWFMRSDIKEMMNCDVILMQENWQDSRGAILEHNIAEKLDFTIIYMKKHKPIDIDRNYIIKSNREELLQNKKMLYLMFFSFVIIFFLFLISYLFE
jgi:hypothetical protein